MRFSALSLGAAAVITAGALFLAGCESSRESASSDTLTKDVGVYPPPPAGAWHPRVGIPNFKAAGGTSAQRPSARGAGLGVVDSKIRVVGKHIELIAEGIDDGAGEIGRTGRL